MGNSPANVDSPVEPKWQAVLDHTHPGRTEYPGVTVHVQARQATLITSPGPPPTVSNKLRITDCEARAGENVAGR
jgi:hypothetical protein